jgi:hypothetical protein
MSSIGLDRQPMRAPTRAIGKIKQHLTNSSLLLLLEPLRKSPEDVCATTFSIIFHS